MVVLTYIQIALSVSTKDETDNAIARHKLPNDIKNFPVFTPFKPQLTGLVVAFTFNWYGQYSGAH
jgi:hypothetical protein